MAHSSLSLSDERDLSWPLPYLPHQILANQVSDKPQRLSRLGSAGQGSEAGILEMH